MLHLAFLSFIRRPLTRLILLFLIALACALPVFLLQTAGGLYDGINRAVKNVAFCIQEISDSLLLGEWRERKTYISKVFYGDFFKGNTCTKCFKCLRCNA